jgi:peptidoglycan/LPS O-acetylase OafA/YrhL
MVVLNALQAGWRGDSERLRTIRDGLLPNIFLVQNYFPFNLRWPNSWSLAIEEHFYLALPLLLVGMAAWGRWRGEQQPAQWFRRLPLIGLGLCGGILLLRLVLAQHVEWKYLYYPTHARADALFFGVLLGYLQHYCADWFGRLARLWPLLLAAVPLALLLPYHFPLTGHPLPSTLGFTVLYLAFGGLVLLAGAYPEAGKNGPAGLSLCTRMLARLGVYSYAVYLCHSVIYTLPGASALRRLLASLAGEQSSLAAAWLDRLAFFTLSIGSAVLLTHLVERPFLRWRERLFSTTPRPEAASRPPSERTGPLHPLAHPAGG